MPDAVLLEWEGVLVDTRDARRDAILRAFADEGVDVGVDAVDAALLGRTAHSSIVMLLAAAGLADPTLGDLVSLRATRAFGERLGKGLTLRTGAHAFIERACVGAPLAVVTGSTRAETEFVLGLAGLEGTVATIVSADDALATPPAPAMLNRAMDTLSQRRALRRDRVIALSSTSLAIRAAREAGVRAIAVCAPAHVSLDADGTVQSLDGMTLSDLSTLAGISMLEQHR